MNCPKCQKEMSLVKEDVSKNFDVNPVKEYERKIFKCETDDVWITYETPKV